MVGVGGFGCFNIRRRFREIEKASPLPSKRRRRLKARANSQRPAGPVLVRGRGLKRRGAAAESWRRLRLLLGMLLLAAIGVGAFVTDIRGADWGAIAAVGIIAMALIVGDPRIRVQRW
jgi:hypothetical protein